MRCVALLCDLRVLSSKLQVRSSQESICALKSTPLQTQVRSERLPQFAGGWKPNGMQFCYKSKLKAFSNHKPKNTYSTWWPVEEVSDIQSCALSSHCYATESQRVEQGFRLHSADDRSGDVQGCGDGLCLQCVAMTGKPDCKGSYGQLDDPRNYIIQLEGGAKTRIILTYVHQSTSYIPTHSSASL